MVVLRAVKRYVTSSRVDVTIRGLCEIREETLLHITTARTATSRSLHPAARKALVYRLLAKDSRKTEVSCASIPDLIQHIRESFRCLNVPTKIGSCSSPRPTAANALRSCVAKYEVRSFS